VSLRGIFLKLSGVVRYLGTSTRSNRVYVYVCVPIHPMGGKLSFHLLYRDTAVPSVGEGEFPSESSIKVESIVPRLQVIVSLYRIFRTFVRSLAPPSSLL
jgi:hypothetical protein